MIAAGDDTPITPIPTECPLHDSMNFTVHLAHESNCSLFYMCERGHKILRICPLRDTEGNRLHFNPLLQVCDWPERAGCTSEGGTTAKPTTPKPTTAKPTTPKPTTAKPTTPKPTTAKPTTSKPTTAKPTTPKPTTAKPTTPKPTTAKPTTPKPTTAKPTTAKPTTPKPTTAKPTTPKPTTPKPTTPKPTTAKPTTPKPTTAKPTTPEPTTAKPTTPKPTTAKPTTPEPTTAKPTTPKPTKTTTKPKTTTKDPPSDDSDSDYTISENPGSSRPPPVSECPPDLLLGTTSIKIPHESNCRLYYTCENGTKVINECDEGLYYDPLLQMCDWESEDSCPRTTPEPEPTSTTTQPINPSSCPEVDPEDPVLLPHECVCNKYYQCRKGEQILKKCPKGKGFSVKLGKCLSLKYSDCLGNDPEVPEDESEEDYSPIPPSTAEPEPPKPPKPPVTDEPEPPKPPKPPVTDEPEPPKPPKPPVTDEPEPPKPPKPPVTDEPEPPKPPKPPVSDEPEPPKPPKPPASDEPNPTPGWQNPNTCIGSCPYVDPIEYTVLLENTDCTKFCKCSNGRAYVYECPANLEFSPKLKVCEYPAIAGCRYKHQNEKQSASEERSFFARLFHW